MCWIKRIGALISTVPLHESPFVAFVDACIGAYSQIMDVKQCISFWLYLSLLPGFVTGNVFNLSDSCFQLQESPTFIIGGFWRTWI